MSAQVVQCFLCLISNDALHYMLFFNGKLTVHCIDTYPGVPTLQGKFSDKNCRTNSYSQYKRVLENTFFMYPDSNTSFIYPLV